MRDWRREASLWAWMLALGVGIMAAALAVVVAEAVFQRVALAGIWCAEPFFIAVGVVVAGVFLMLRSGFGWGAISGSGFRVPPAWLVGGGAVFLFWLWLWWTGPRPRPPNHSVLAPAPRGHEAVFIHGGVWLLGAVISCGIALTIWQAVFPRVLAAYGRRSELKRRLGRMLAVLPLTDPVEATRAGPSGAEIERWLLGSEGPVQAGEESLFVREPSPERIIASLRPAHLYGTAGTLGLIGQNGAGKSSLLRLAQGSPEARNEIELLFVYISLWEYKTAQAAIESMIEKVLQEVRDKIDIFPFTGAARAFIRAMTGDGRLQWLTDTLALRVSIEDNLRALSAVLLLNKLRIIVCIEDNDRVEDASLKSQLVGLITGAMDFIRQFPGFGYVICVSSSDWNELQAQALSKVEETGKREARHGKIFELLKARERTRKGKYGSLLKRGASQGTGVPEAGTDGISDPLVSLLNEEIEARHRASEAAAKEQLQGFDTTRLCREDLVIPLLRPQQWEPVLKHFREKMLEGSSGPERTRFGFSDADREASWAAFIKAVKASATAAVPFNPEYSISFTPRTLRRGLSDARRKWSAIKAQLGDTVVVDPDSVLVACLVRSCRPDVWNTLIRTAQLLDGAD